MESNLLNQGIRHSVEESIKNEDNDSCQPVLHRLELLELDVLLANLIALNFFSIFALLLQVSLLDLARQCFHGVTPIIFKHGIVRMFLVLIVTETA